MMLTASNCSEVIDGVGDGNVDATITATAAELRDLL